MNKTVSLLLVVLWTIIIFGFSSMSGTTSNGMSKGILSNTIEKTKILPEHELTIEKKEDPFSLFNKIHYYFRKTAHFSEYLILSLLLINHLRFYKIKEMYLLTIAICFIFSVIDELNQMFTFDRSSLLTDSLLDTFGAIVGVLIAIMISKRKKLNEKVI